MKWMTRITSRLEAFCMPFGWVHGLYHLYYRELIRREIQLARIGTHDRILFVGGGSMPCSAIELARQIQAEIHVIDQDPAAVEKAQQHIQALGLADCIHCFHASGQTVDADDYTVILIAAQACPQQPIFEHILAKAGKHTRILVRHPKRLFLNIYAPLPEDYRCRCCSQVRHLSPTLSYTCLFRPNEMGRTLR